MKLIKNLNSVWLCNIYFPIGTGLIDPSVCISTGLNLKLTPGCVIYLLQSNGHPDFSAIFGRQILNVKFFDNIQRSCSLYKLNSIK